jgi:hypothetical protein
MIGNQSAIQPGRYPAQPTGVASVYENDKGSLVLAMDFTVEGQELRWWTTLATEKDGLNTRHIDHLKQCFPWDGADPFWFADNAEKLCRCDVEVTVELRPGTKNPDKLFPAIAFVDPPGGGLIELPQGDRRALLAKYGAKFRAIAGGTPMRPPTASGHPPASRPMTPTEGTRLPPVKAPQSGKESTEAECWAKWCELNAATPEKELAVGWFATLERLLPGVNLETFTPSQWGQVMADLDDYIPF